MAKASPDTRQREEILSYSLTWNPDTQSGAIQLITAGYGAKQVPVKSLADLSSLAELLRTEKPMFVRQTSKQWNFIIHTGEEPAGEEDRG